MTRSVRRLAAIALGGIAVAVSLTACQQGSTDMSHRPPIHEVVDRYDATVSELRDVVSAAYPDASWTEDGAPSQAAGKADGTVVVTSSIWYAVVPLADDEPARDRLLKKADEVVRSHGFAAFSVVQAVPGDFSYVTGDAWGGELHFSGGKSVTIRYTTGEHPAH